MESRLQHKLKLRADSGSGFPGKLSRTEHGGAMLYESFNISERPNSPRKYLTSNQIKPPAQFYLT